MPKKVAGVVCVKVIGHFVKIVSEYVVLWESFHESPTLLHLLRPRSTLATNLLLEIFLRIPGHTQESGSLAPPISPTES